MEKNCTYQAEGHITLAHNVVKLGGGDFAKKFKLFYFPQLGKEAFPGPVGTCLASPP